MARIHQTGFEQNSTSSDGLSPSGSPAINSSTVHGGSYSLEIKSLVSGTAQKAALTSGSIGSGNIRYFRFYLYLVTLPSASNAIFSSSNNTAGSLIKLNSDGSLGLWDTSSTQIGSNSAALNTGQWYRVEVHQDYTNSAGSRTIEARIDGTNFASTTTAQITNVTCAPSHGGNLLSEAQTQGDWLFDDCAVNDGSGTAQNSWPGAGAIVHLQPNAAGDNNAWSIQTGGTAGAANNYTRVDEVTPNGLTDYNGSNTLGQLDDYGCTSLPGGVSLSSVTCVAVCPNFAGAGASSNASFVTRCKKASAGTVSEGATLTPSNTAFQSNSNNHTLTNVLYTDPDGAAWTTTTLNSMQIGMHLTATNTNAVRVSTLWASIDYVPVNNYTSTVTGILTLAGTPQKAVGRSTSAGLTGSGATRRFTNHYIAGVLTFTGALGPRNIVHALGGVLQLAGTARKATTRILPNGALTLAGTAQKATARKLNGVLRASGTSQSLHGRYTTLTGVLTLPGTIARSSARNLTGNLQLVGSKSLSTIRLLPGSLHLIGTAIKIPSKAFGGILTLSGTNQKSTNRSIAGTLQLVGSKAISTSRSLTGILRFAGSNQKSASRSVSGQLTPNGSLKKSVGILAAASLVLAGTVAAVKNGGTHAYTLTLTGVLTLSGAIQRATNRTLQSAALQFVGNTGKQTTRKLTQGTLTASGTIQKATVRLVTGILTLNGAKAIATARKLSGALTLNGSSFRSTARSLAAQLTFSGSQAKQTRKNQAGTLSASGTARKATSRLQAAALILTGSSSKGIVRQLAGILTLNGALVPSRAYFKILAASLTASGSISKGIGRIVQAVLSFVGRLLPFSSHKTPSYTVGAPVGGWTLAVPATGWLVLEPVGGWTAQAPSSGWKLTDPQSGWTLGALGT